LKFRIQNQGSAQLRGSIYFEVINWETGQFKGYEILNDEILDTWMGLLDKCSVGVQDYCSYIFKIKDTNLGKLCLIL